MTDTAETSSVNRKRIIRKTEVKRRTSLQDTSIDRLEKRNLFPLHVVLGPRAIGWYEHEIDEWIDTRKRGIDITKFNE
jgi:prophage regulatory protein